MHTPFARLRPGFFLAALGALLALAGCPHPLPADPGSATDSAGAIASLDTTGVRDAAPAIQAALDALGDHGGTVQLPPGNLVLRSPLVIGPGAIWRRNVRLLGAGSTGADSSSTTLWWRGDPNVAPVQIRGAHNTLEGVRIVPAAGKLAVALDIDWDADSGMECTRNTVRHVCLQGPMTCGIRLAATAPANGDDCTFEDVTVGGFTQYGFWVPNQNMQAKCENLTGCRFETGAGYPGSTAVFLQSGSVRLYHCWFEGSETLIKTLYNTDYQVFEDCQAEGFKAIAYCGGAVNGMPVLFRGGRFGYSLPPDGRLQIAVRGGPLLLEGVKFEGDYAGDRFLIDAEGADWATTSILADGCWFPTDKPRFTCDQKGGVILRGCRGLRADRSEVSWSHWERGAGLTLVGHEPSVTTSTPNDHVEPSALLNVVSTEQGFLPPRMSTAQRLAIPAPAEGLVVYDLDLHALCVRGADGWMVLAAR